MEIKITKADVIWGYIATFFQIASGIIVLPFILKMLSPEEIGLNYLMVTVASMIALVDFGFAPQFGRNISYLFGGAQKLQKEGIVAEQSDSINYHLIATMIEVAKMVYKKLSVAVLFLMSTGGTVYIYKVTNGFSTVNNTVLIWIVFCLSSFFNMYFAYYNSLLIGRGFVMQSKKAIMASRLTYIILSILLLYLGFGLLGTCIANLVSPFVGRYLSYKFFYDSEFLLNIKNQIITDSEKKDTFNTIWYNSKKIGINLVGTYCINKFGMFLAGLYLTLEQVASYGLMTQLGTIVITLSTTMLYTNEPKLASLIVEDSKDRLLKEYSFLISSFHILAIIGSLVFIVLGPWGIELIHSKTTLPNSTIVGLYMLVMILEQNHSASAVLITLFNEVPFIKSSLVSAAMIVLTSWALLNYTNLGILGLVVAQGACQLAYNNWHWPIAAYRLIGSNPIKGEFIGLCEVKNKISKLINSYYGNKS